MYITVPFLALNGTMAQEVVTGLQSNSDILKNYNFSHLKSGGISDTIDLPFFDDFSGYYISPDDSLWSDNEAYINNTYPVMQLSTGVATLDALADNGLLHDNASSNTFEADHLTSSYINLEGTGDDNFYLSFFYQPGGAGDQPEASDSLVLQFYSPDTGNWLSIWKTEGKETHPFKPVILKIDNPIYTQKGFRFRFINYASISDTQNDPAMAGNADHWHIDYVYLDRDRSMADTILHDVAFTKPPRSLLKSYSSMPWKQFNDWSLAEMGDSLYASLINNDNIERNISRSFVIRDVYNDQVVHSFDPLAKNIAPGARDTFGAPVLYTFNSSATDSALFEITATLITDIFDRKDNDTVRFMQVFSDYYAYDDGSSEAGYGINGQGSDNAIVAYRYRALSPDTIRAVDICFNDSYLGSNRRSFDIVIMSAINQVPGDIIYSQEDLLVDPGSSVNGFRRYTLSVPVAVSDYFFVGWRQRSETFLNAGLDINTPHTGRQFYFLNGTWYESGVNGSLMIRPVTGTDKTTGINDIKPGATDKNGPLIWPNPASDYLNIKYENSYPDNRLRLDIYSNTGILVRSVLFSERIDLTGVPSGLYLLCLSLDGKTLSYSKLIINK